MANKELHFGALCGGCGGVLSIAAVTRRHFKRPAMIGPFSKKSTGQTIGSHAISLYAMFSSKFLTQAFNYPKSEQRTLLV